VSTAEVVDRVRDVFRRAGIDAVVATHEPATLGPAIQRAAESRTDVVVVGGGDGTISAAAQVLVGGSMPLGMLPLGTLNHFANDLGVPVELDEAVATIAAGHVREVDVGEVNGRYFLNNSSIGVYPAAVDQREELRHRRGGGKWMSMFRACVDVIRRYPLLAVSVRVGNRAVVLRTPFLFVGNNRYEMGPLSLGTRSTLQGGELSLYLSRDVGRFGLVRQALRAGLGSLEQDRDFQSLMVTDVEIVTRRRSIRVAVDGEVVPMRSPIQHRIRPRALRVFAPRLQAPSPAA
jgi:diacylglycerol kinase family enzyme